MIRLTQLAGLSPVALAAPESSWPAIAGWMAHSVSRFFERDGLLMAMPDELPRLAGLSKADAVERYIAGCYEEDMATLRAISLRGWDPRTRVVGLERLEAAMAEDNGAILWVDDFEFASLVVKMALHRAGHQLTHLSRPGHGFLNTAFGARYLNPLQARVEDRYMGERIVIDAQRPVSGLRRLRECLEQGDVVSITVGDNAWQTVSAPLFDGDLSLASGPLTLAYDSGRRILPVFTLRQPSGGFIVHIEEPLPRGSSRRDARPYEAYASKLRRYLAMSPMAWRGWKNGWHRTQSNGNASATSALRPGKQESNE